MQFKTIPVIHSPLLINATLFLLAGTDSLNGMLSPPLTVDSSESSSGSSKESSSAKLSPQQQQQQQPWCGKPEMLPFLSLCSRYPGSPWAGLLQQTIKEKQQSMAAAAAAASGEIFGPFRIFNFLRSFFRSMYLSCWAKKNRHYKDRSARVSEQRLTQSKYQGYFFSLLMATELALRS